ncbi:HNH endonuclease [Nitrospirillum sp. BR 11828]|uniref:HNH endonuclease n=1 Tax=Nitrospirillum sp. BR 11828 TaxID=3104325 RepID=UPI002ACAB8BA|nr:HNH endonuclease [Nitrospirillum sp. BR 11828]MDZ5649047.1 HNH endonuclease [Nitrospirillum sp. BR 11828]
MQPKMSHVHTYDAIRKCIYCGKGDNFENLTTEHIIPESLGGTIKLPSASCSDCQKFTSAFEGRNAGRLFRPVRRQFDFPSKSRGRKQKELRQNETFRVIVDGVKRDLPAKDYPGLLITFEFPYPTALMGIPPTFENFAGGISIATLPDFGLRLNALRARYGNAVSFPTSGNSEDVGRLLAKIGYSYAVAELGLNVFKPYVLGIIRGHDVSLLRHLVGGDLTKSPAGDDLHEIELVPPGALGFPNLVVVRIRLFANCPGTATYLVVVGEIGTLT